MRPSTEERGSFGDKRWLVQSSYCICLVSYISMFTDWLSYSVRVWQFWDQYGFDQVGIPKEIGLFRRCTDCIVVARTWQELFYIKGRQCLEEKRKRMLKTHFSSLFSKKTNSRVILYIRPVVRDKQWNLGWLGSYISCKAELDTLTLRYHDRGQQDNEEAEAEIERPYIRTWQLLFRYFLSTDLTLNKNNYGQHAVIILYLKLSQDSFFEIIIIMR